MIYRYRVLLPLQSHQKPNYQQSLAWLAHCGRTATLLHVVKNWIAADG